MLDADVTENVAVVLDPAAMFPSVRVAPPCTEYPEGRPSVSVGDGAVAAPVFCTVTPTVNVWFGPTCGGGAVAAESVSGGDMTLVVEVLSDATAKYSVEKPD